MASIQQKGDWWYLRYRDADGVERTRALKTQSKSEAKAVCEDFNTAERKRKAASRSVSERTMRQAWVPFQKRLKLKHTEATQDNYALAFNKYLLPKFGDRMLDSITAMEIEDYFADLLDTLTPKRLNVMRMYLSGFYTYCRDHGLCRTHPVKLVTKLGEGPPKDRTINLEHAMLLMEELPPRYRVAFATMYFAGIRLGECAGLTWNDYSRSREMLFIRRSVYRNGQTQIARTGAPFQRVKSKGSRRDIPLPMVLMEILDEWKRTKEQRPNEWDLIFPSSNGRVLNAGEFRKQLKAAATRAAPRVKGSEPLIVDWISPHIARSGFARLYLESFGNIRDLSRWLGHADIATTMIYLRWAPGHSKNPTTLILNTTVVSGAGITIGDMGNALVKSLAKI